MPTNNGSSWITALRRLAIYIRDGWRCMYCGRDLRGASKRDMTLEHLDTRAECRKRAAAGKAMHPSNRLIMACRGCNSRRGDRMTWAAFVRYIAGPQQQDAAEETIRSIRATVRRPLNLEAARSILAGESLDTELES